MEFPVYQVPFAGNGLIIGLNAVLHVLISHGLAVGGFAMVLLALGADQLTFRTRSLEWTALASRLLKFVVITTTVLGAVTGAGIWLTITALAPRGAASMLRVFFWPWFIEWAAFLLEVVVILRFYLAWIGNHPRRRRILRVTATIYGVTVFASAFLITGILGFMLTPGGWPENRNWLDGFFNPSFPPQLLARLALAMTLGSLVAIGFTLWPRRSQEFQNQAVALFAAVLGTSLLVFIVAAGWYFSVVPLAYSVRSVFSVLTSRLASWPALFYGGNLLALLLLVLLVVAGRLRRPTLVRALAIPALLAFIAVVGQFERIREFIRGPFLMPGYMYVSGPLLEERPFFARHAALPHQPWYPAPPADARSVTTAGAFLFAQNCTGCHTVGGLNSITDRLRGRSEDGIYVLLGRTHEMVSFMPPLATNTLERRMVARFLYELTAGRLQPRWRARLLFEPASATPAGGAP